MARTFTVPTTQGDMEILFNNRALYEFERVHGASAGSVLLSGSMGNRAITHFVWAGLLHENRKITVESVVDLIDLSQIKQTVDAIIDAMEDATATGLEPVEVGKKKKG